MSSRRPCLSFIRRYITNTAQLQDHLLRSTTQWNPAN